MNSKYFNKLVEDRIEKIRNTLATKGAEYSTDDNKLHNFDKAGIKRNTTREIALQGMLTKHEVSIDDIILRTKGGKFPSIEVINEKLGDIINYYILLEACLVDRINQKNIEEDFNRRYPIVKDEAYVYIPVKDTLIEKKSISVEGQKFNVGDIIRLKLDKDNHRLFLNFIEKNYVQYYELGYGIGEYPKFTSISIKELNDNYELWNQEDS